MEKREPKDLSIYDRRFEEDPSSFNDFQAMDYVRELKNQERTDDAIEVGRTFLQVGEGLTGFINHYGYALYNKFINLDDEQIAEKEDLFFSILEEICSLCKQERFSPFEATINKAVKYVLNKKDTDYKKLSELLDRLDVQKLSVEPFINKSQKEYESKRERWYRLQVKALYQLGEYTRCIEIANTAFTQPMKWHYNNLNWIKYYRASSLVKVERYEEAENEFLALGNKIPTGDSFDVLYELYLNTDKKNEAYTNLIYKFFNDGYDIKNLPLYTKILEMTKQGQNKDVALLAEAFIYQLKVENGQSVDDLSIDDNYKDTDSSSLYDRFYNQLMEHLDEYIEREENRVVYYNSDKEFGSIYQEDNDNLFFRQADYIYDEDVQKRDIVEYSIMKTFDVKKQVPTTKAVLIKTLYEDIHY
jgi:hypothetical protein